MKKKSPVLALLLITALFTGCSRSNPEQSSGGKMPAKIFGGGGRKVFIEVNVSSEAQLGFMGTLPRKPDGSQPLEEYNENISPGTHAWTIELAPHTGGTFDLRALNPQVGNRLAWTVKLDGKQLANETDVLDKPLPAGTAWFLQVGIERERESPEAPEE